MADRKGLTIIGLILAGVTLATVTLAGAIVQWHLNGTLSFEETRSAAEAVTLAIGWPLSPRMADRRLSWPSGFHKDKSLMEATMKTTAIALSRFRLKRATAMPDRES